MKLFVQKLLISHQTYKSFLIFITLSIFCLFKSPHQAKAADYPPKKFKIHACPLTDKFFHVFIGDEWETGASELESFNFSRKKRMILYDLKEEEVWSKTLPDKHYIAAEPALSKDGRTIVIPTSAHKVEGRIDGVLILGKDGKEIINLKYLDSISKVSGVSLSDNGLYVVIKVSEYREKKNLTETMIRFYNLKTKKSWNWSFKPGQVKGKVLVSNKGIVSLTYEGVPYQFSKSGKRIN